ncbi:MAG: transglycosylase domain-containing protein, partial [Eubacteriales bacterium]
EILLSYLNIINLSDGCFGVGAAAEYYFSKDVSELTLNECACIAAITNSPYYYNPIRNPENNKQRRNLIIEQMYLQGYISEEEYTSAYDTEVTLNTSDTGEADKINSWYVDMVIEDVIDDLINEMGYSRSMAALMLYTGGLNIYITMDPDVQKVLDKYYSEPDNFYAPGNEENPQSSMIVIDPQTGDILGVAGAVGTKNANRIQNFATQTLRPAGSVIKPLSVYAPALEEGAITWASVFDDVPVNFGNYNLDEESGRIVYPVAWPRNAYGTYRGLTNVNYALTHSLNTVTVRVLEELGLEKSFHYLYDDLDMKSLIYSRVLDDGSKISDMDYAALAMGQFNYGVTVRETTAAYSIFANNGVYNSTRSYLKVMDGKGNTVLEKPYSGKAVLSEANASIMTLMLRNVVYGGTAKEITLKNRIDVAGKTGTTQNSCDRWFIGYTPYYICGTWFGYEYPKPLTAYSSNPCNRIWNEVMEILHEKYFDAEQSGTPLKSFVISDDVVSAEYCADSGKILTEACRHDPRGSRTEVGYFVKGTEPTEYCDTHVLVDYDTEYGGIACPECPSEKTVKVGLIKVVRVFPMQIYVTDAEYVYRDIGTQTMPETSSSLPFFANLLGENEYSGISNSQTQYNRYCREHFNYHEWKKRRDGG